MTAKWPNEKRLYVTDDSLRAIVRREKTRTSRVIVKGYPGYKKGDLLWLTYAWATHKVTDNMSPTESHDYWNMIPPLWIRAFHGDDDAPGRGRWRKSRFLPRVFAQHFCRILDVEIMHIQNLTDVQILEEGADNLIRKYGDGDVKQALLNMYDWKPVSKNWTFHIKARLQDAPMDRRTFYSVWWDSLNYKRGYGWEMNPSVYHIHFEYLPTHKPFTDDLRPSISVPVLDDENA
jgi:hypothetical protein